MDFFIHVDQKGMRSGFEPQNPVTGEEVILCLALGLRGICCLLADKLDMPLEDVHRGLQVGMIAAFDEETIGKIVRKCEEENDDIDVN